ncbi:hypothetical protein NKG05_17890 [Oerskovia sp. M15]
MAFFRGNAEVDLADLRAVLPFVLHDKLVPTCSPRRSTTRSASPARRPRLVDP